MTSRPYQESGSPPPASGPRDPDAELPPGTHLDEDDTSERGDVDRRQPYAEGDPSAGQIGDD